jgi:hypothetical protein
MRKELRRDDVIGHRLVDIRQRATWNDNGLDWAWTYYVLDSGVTFFLPADWVDVFVLEPVPSDAGPLGDNPVLDNVYNKEIVEVLRWQRDCGAWPDSTYLLLEDGYLVTDVLAERHGLGAAGVHVFGPGEIDTAGFRPFWSK